MNSPVDRDFTPENPELESGAITSEQLADVLNDLYEGRGPISKTESLAILRAMQEPTRPITREYIEDTHRVSELTPVQKLYFERVADMLGFPSDDEDITIEAMDPKKMQWYLHTERGKDVLRSNVLNNEFRLFTVDPFDLETYPEALVRHDYSSLSSETHPALLRLEAVFPELRRALHEYGIKEDGTAKRMGVFYDGLIQDTPESRRYLVLFTFADSLMQRLIRPRDFLHRSLMIEAMLNAEEAGESLPALPRYDEVPERETNTIKVAHRALWT